MTQTKLEQERKLIGMGFKIRRLSLFISARELMEASENTLTIATIYKFERGGSSHGDTRVIYEYTIKKLETEI